MNPVVRRRDTNGFSFTQISANQYECGPDWFSTGADVIEIAALVVSTVLY